MHGDDEQILFWWSFHRPRGEEDEFHDSLHSMSLIRDKAMRDSACAILTKFSKLFETNKGLL